MPIPIDFIVNLAAGLTQTLIQHFVELRMGDSQMHALQRVFESAFRDMLRNAGSGLSVAEAGQVSNLFQLYLKQPNAADNLLKLALGSKDINIDDFVASFTSSIPHNSLLHIKFDPKIGILELISGVADALLTEAKLKDSPLANFVNFSLLEAILRHTRRVLELVHQDARYTEPFIVGKLTNFEIHRDISEIAICQSNPKIIYVLIDKTLFVSKDQANTWNSANAGGISRIAVDAFDPAIVYSLRTNGLFVSQDFGETWSCRSDKIRYETIGGGEFTVHPAESQKMLYSNVEGVHVSTDQGFTWRNCFSGLRSSGTVPWHYAIDRKRSGVVVAACYDRGLYLTENWGETWTEINLPPTGDKPNPGCIKPIAIDSMTSSIWYADLGSWRERVHSSTHLRGLFVTRDHGKSWQQAFLGGNFTNLIEKQASESGDSTDLLVDYIEIVEKTEKTIIYTSYPGGTTYCSQDNGHNWNPVIVAWDGLPSTFNQDSESTLFLAPVDALTKDGLVYLKTHYGLLKSRDYGRTWYY